MHTEFNTFVLQMASKNFQSFQFLLNKNKPWSWADLGQDFVYLTAVMYMLFIALVVPQVFQLFTCLWQIVSSTDNLCKQFWPRLGPTKYWACQCPDPNCLTLWWYSRRILWKKLIFMIIEKKHGKLPSMKRYVINEILCGISEALEKALFSYIFLFLNQTFFFLCMVLIWRVLKYPRSVQ